MNTSTHAHNVDSCRFWLHEFSTKKRCVLAYSTGRELPSYQKLIEQVTARLVPSSYSTDYCNVGTLLWGYV